jgi:phage-related protein
VTNFQAVYYRDPHGREPVRAFVESLEADVQAALDNQIDRLNLLSDAFPHLPFPHSSQVVGELRELRCHYGRSLYRILYQRSHRLLVLLHIFPKSSSKIPAVEIRLAQRRWEDFKARMDAPVRTPPRAAGRDAP